MKNQIFNWIFLHIISIKFVNGDRQQCSQNYIATLDSQIPTYITSYNFPFNYQDNLTCYHQIYLPNSSSNDNLSLCFTFFSFSLETSSPYCSFDYLEMGSQPTVKFCGLGLWQYGVEVKSYQHYNIWSPNLCWDVSGKESFNLTFSSDNSVNSTGFLATFTLKQPPPTTAPAHQGYAPCRNEEWTCVLSRKCIPRSQLCDSFKNCPFDGSDETYMYAKCPGQQNVLACDFTAENFCQLTYDKGWYKATFSEKSNIYIVPGPTGDHTNGTSGFFIYSNSTPAILMSQEILMQSGSKPEGLFCLRFSYFIFSDPSSVSLSVYLHTSQAYMRPEWMLFPMNQDQVFSNAMFYHFSGSWRLAEIVVDLKSQAMQFVLRVDKRDELETNFNKVRVAIDDISVLPGICSGIDMQCNFESSMCGWISFASMPDSLQRIVANGVTLLPWLLRSPGNENKQNIDLTFDKSSSTGNGGYTYVSFNTNQSSPKHALLQSPVVSMASTGTVCLYFWYHNSSVGCQLRTYLQNFDNSIYLEPLWTSRDPDKKGTWKEEQVWKMATQEINRDAPFRIIFHGFSNDVSQQCSIAIDHIRFDMMPCSMHYSIPCAPNEFQCISDGECIIATKQCDGIKHCNDGSDESRKAGCEFDSECDFRCLNSSICIKQEWICDEQYDCDDKSDEANCFGYGSEIPLQPPVSRQMTTVQPDKPNCYSGNCTARPGNAGVECSAGYLCQSSQICLPKSLVCDGHEHCPDASDEANCFFNIEKNIGLLIGIIISIIFFIIIIIVVILTIASCQRKRSKRFRHAPDLPPPPPHPILSHPGISLATVATIFDDNMAYMEERHMVPPPSYQASNHNTRMRPCDLDPASVSMPPTPARYDGGMSMMQYRSDDGSDHIYEEPSRVCAPRVSNATLQKSQRIRLGTTALRSIETDPKIVDDVRMIGQYGSSNLGNSTLGRRNMDIGTLQRSRMANGVTAPQESISPTSHLSSSASCSFFPTNRKYPAQQLPPGISYPTETSNSISTLNRGATIGQKGVGSTDGSSFSYETSPSSPLLVSNPSAEYRYIQQPTRI